MATSAPPGSEGRNLRSPQQTEATLTEEPPGGAGSLTLHRGLLVLELIAKADHPVTTAHLAQRLGLHRSVAYRLVRTLEQHRLVHRDGQRGYRPGGGLAVLAGRLGSALRFRAQHCLEQVAEAHGFTAFLVEAHGDLAVTTLVTEPRSTLAHVAYRPGGQHPLSVGAPGLAILAGRPEQAGERPEVSLARARGWAHSRGEVIAGCQAVAVPVLEHHSTAEAGRCHASVAVVYAGDNEMTQVVADLQTAAQAIAGAAG